MNWAKFRKNVGMIVKIEPPACQMDERNHICQQAYDDWLIEGFSEDFASLRNQRTNHLAKLGKDHIYDFRSDPSRSHDGVSLYGFLVLKMQIFTKGPEIWMRPNGRPGDPVSPSDATHHQINWTGFTELDVNNAIPITATSARIQYRLWTDEVNVPLLIRLAMTPDGRGCQELSGPSGVIDQLVIDGAKFYVSVSHPKVSYEISVLGYQFER
jgi:hypothetical protein